MQILPKNLQPRGGGYAFRIFSNGFLKTGICGQPALPECYSSAIRRYRQLKSGDRDRRFQSFLYSKISSTLQSRISQRVQIVFVFIT